MQDRFPKCKTALFPLRKPELEIGLACPAYICCPPSCCHLGPLVPSPYWNQQAPPIIFASEPVPYYLTKHSNLLRILFWLLLWKLVKGFLKASSWIILSSSLLSTCYLLPEKFNELGFSLKDTIFSSFSEVNLKCLACLFHKVPCTDL